MNKKQKKRGWPIKMTRGLKQHLESLETAYSVPFHNNKGDRILIPKNYTIDDLLRMGVKEIRLERKGSFLPDGWYEISPRTNNNKQRKEK